MPPNRLAIEVSLATGLRIDDVLHLRPAQIEKEKTTVTEMKTGKKRRIRLPSALRDELLKQSGRYWVFPGRVDVKKPRTRQAVYKDIRRAKEAFRVRENLTPHSARKYFAVQEYKRSGSISHVKELLNHSNEAVTMVYALADTINTRTVSGK